MQDYFRHDNLLRMGFDRNHNLPVNFSLFAGQNSSSGEMTCGHPTKDVVIFTGEGLWKSRILFFLREKLNNL